MYVSSSASNEKRLESSREVGWPAQERASVGFALERASVGSARERASVESARERISFSSISGSVEGSYTKPSMGWGHPMCLFDNRVSAPTKMVLRVQYIEKESERDPFLRVAFIPAHRRSVIPWLLMSSVSFAEVMYGLACPKVLVEPVLVPDEAVSRICTALMAGQLYLHKVDNTCARSAIPTSGWPCYPGSTVPVLSWSCLCQVSYTYPRLVMLVPDRPYLHQVCRVESVENVAWRVHPLFTLSFLQPCTAPPPHPHTHPVAPTPPLLERHFFRVPRRGAEDQGVSLSFSSFGIYHFDC
ncbi:hypothetical protein GW17_00013880 [Ensete ventricosum]|nr:hypothetical protein GW17_00013880 [Ensete ventricosum]